MKSVTGFTSRRTESSNASIAYLFVLLFIAVSAYAQTSLSGYWLLKVPNGDGTFRETYFELKQDGELFPARYLAAARTERQSQEHSKQIAFTLHQVRRLLPPPLAPRLQDGRWFMTALSKGQTDTANDAAREDSAGRSRENHL
jgi:hypothetical protein